MLDRKEEGDPPTKFRPPRINFEPKSGSERGRERKVCENTVRKGFEEKYKKIGETLSRKFRERGRMIIIIILAMQNLSQSLQFREEKRITVIQGGGRVYKDNT